MAGEVVVRAERVYMADCIILNNIQVYGYHGVNQYEKDKGQIFSVDLEIECDLKKAGLTDLINETVDYSLLYSLVKSVVEGPSYNLLESVAEKIAEGITDSFRTSKITVAVKKIDPTIFGSYVGSAGVKITRDGANQSID